MKRRYKLYRAKKYHPISKRIEYVYFTSISSAHSYQLKRNRMLGRADGIDEVEIDMTKKAVCRLLNDITI